MNRKIVFKKIASVTPSLLKRIEELKKHAPNFQERVRTPEQEKEHRDKFCSKQNIIVSIFAFDNDIMVGKLNVVTRKIFFAGKKILLGGIGGVEVHVDYRQRGIASRLMKLAIVELKNKKCTAAFLCTDLKNPILLHFYQKFGFVPLARPYTYLGKSGKRYTDTDGMVAPVVSQKTFKEILKSKELLDLGVGNW